MMIIRIIIIVVISIEILIMIMMIPRTGKAGAAATKTMKAKAGRASYVAADKVKAADPGAVAAAAWFEALAKVFW